MTSHPFLVHFPIAFLLLAPAVDLIDRRRPALKLRGAADLLYALGALGAVAAATAGQTAFDSISLDGSALRLAQRHQNAGTLASWLAVAAAMGRLIDRLEQRKSARAGWRPTGVAAVFLGLLAAVSITWAGLLGGELVHEAGVTAATAPPRAAGHAAPRQDQVRRRSGRRPRSGSFR